MPRLKWNAAANVAGQVWSALLGFLLLPLYVRLLGPEGFGLLGFVASLQAILATLDLGLGTTTNREIARRRAAGAQYPSSDSRDLLRTLELLYALVGLVVGLAVVLGARGIAEHWLNAERVTPETIRLALVIVGVTIAIRWPLGLYAGVLRGLEQQVRLNSIMAAAATVRGVGAVLVLAIVSPTVTAFLLWTLVVGIAEIVVLGVVAWRSLPAAPRPPRASLSLLRSVWRFSLQVTGIAIFAAILKNVDRVLISRLLPLEALGYYSLAAAIVTGLLLPASGIAGAVFPRLSALGAAGDDAAVADTYHRSARSVAFVSAALTGFVLFFAADLLQLWMRSEAVTARTSLTLSILAGATMLNSLMQIPYMLQLAAGLAWLPLATNGIAAVLLAPLAYFLIAGYGLPGAGVAWVAFNLFYCVLVPPVMHRHVLPGHLRGWWQADTVPFVLISVAAFGGARLAATDLGSPVARLAVGLVATGLYLVATRRAGLWPRVEAF